MNIWSIKSKALRAIVAWLAMLVLSLIASVLFPLLVVFFGIVGAVRGIRSEFEGFVDVGDWLALLKTWWRAATGKEAV